jgi:hypothetical protein
MQFMIAMQMFVSRGRSLMHFKRVWCFFPEEALPRVFF